MILEWFWIPEFCVLCKKESGQESERTKKASGQRKRADKESKHNNNNGSFRLSTPL
jgi:hypothetical protein